MWWVFSILHQYFYIIQGSTVGKDHLQLLAVSLVFSQPSDEVMQLVIYVQDIHDHASLQSKNKEEAASGASMLATPIYIQLTARMEMY